VAVKAFVGHLHVERPIAVPNVTDPDFANPLLIQIAALLAVRGEAVQPDTGGSVRRSVLDQWLKRERARWEHLKSENKLAGLHKTHEQRAVLVAVLTGPTLSEAPGILAILKEFSDSTLERRGKIAYWLADLYPETDDERLLISFGPDLLVERLLESAAESGAELKLKEIVDDLHRHPAVGRAHRSRMLAVLSLAADRSAAVRSVLYDYLVEHVVALVQGIIRDEAGRDLANSLQGALALFAQQPTPGQKLGRACLRIERDAEQTELDSGQLGRGPGEHCAELLRTTMMLALPAVIYLLDNDETISDIYALQVRHLMISSMFQRSNRAGWLEESVACALEMVEVRRLMVQLEPSENRPLLSFELGNLAAAYGQTGQFRKALAVAEEAVTIGQQSVTNGDEHGINHLARALDALGLSLANMGQLANGLTAINEEISLLRQLVRQDIEDDYTPYLARALGARGKILSDLGRTSEALDTIEEARATSSAPSSGEALSEQRYHLSNAAAVKVAAGDLRGAMADAKRATEVGRRLVMLNPRRYRLDLITDLIQLGDFYIDLDNVADAVKAIQEAISLTREGTGEDRESATSGVSRILRKLQSRQSREGDSTGSDPAG
jgi:tetratricopeptide (TPR) repeat protein